MSQLHPALDDPHRSGVSAADLAARLASKLCHDFISPASAIISGLGLLDDPSAKDMRDDAMDLIATSARKLIDHLAFARIAYGAASGVTMFDVAELERLTRAVYAHGRAELDWVVAAPTLPKAPAQTLVNLAQLAAGALPLGGLARLEVTQDGEGYLVSALAKGPKARLHAEVRGGLLGEPLGDGLAGRWVQACYVNVIAGAAGGRLEAEAADEVVTLRARIPA
jgi:histidine phosphotransferase ChpT